MNKRWSCLKPELTQSVLIGSFSLKNLILAVKEGNLTEILQHTHSILLKANQKSGHDFQLGGNSVGQEAFQSPIILAVLCMER